MRGRASGSNGLGLGLLDHPAGFGVALFDVLLKHLFFYAPLAPATHLNGLEFPAPDEGISGRGIDLQLFSYVCKGQESGHTFILPPMTAPEVVIHSLALFERMTFDLAVLP
jgi:hypothetical protein